MPIWKQTNEVIGSYAPHVYLANRSIVCPEAASDVASHYGIDPSFLEGDFTRDQYDLFIMDRKKRFIEMIRRATGCTPDEIVHAED